MLGSGLAVTLSCDLYGFPWNNLLQTRGLNVEIVQAIVALKGTITHSDIYTVIRCVDDEDSTILQFTIDHCTPKFNDFDLIKLYGFAKQLKKSKFAEEVMSYSLSTRDPNKLIQEAMSLKSLDFAEKILVSQGTNINPALVVNKMHWNDVDIKSNLVSCIKSTPQGLLQLFLKAVEYHHFKLAEDYFLTMDAATKSTIDLSCILKFPMRQVTRYWRQQFVSFIGKLLELGMDSNGQGDICPLDVVLKLSNDYSNEKIELILLLLQHGVAIGNCIYEEINGTTLIHTATEFAINSGKFLVLIFNFLTRYVEFYYNR